MTESIAKIIDGDFSPKKSYVLFKNEKIELVTSTGFFSSEKIDLKSELKGTKLLDESTTKSFLKAAGFGTAGAILLGPVGLLAGALVESKSKNQKIIACELKSSEKFIVQLNGEQYVKLITAVPEQINLQDETINENPLDSLKKLKELYDANIISETEFNDKKEKLLQKI